MISKDDIDRSRLPGHVAIIMDGNGRWASRRNRGRIFGHKNGVAAVRETVEAAAELGIPFLTLYAFSTENWKRPRNEVSALFKLLVSTIHKEASKLYENGIRLLTVGDLASVPEVCRKELAEIIAKSARNEGMTVVLAISYSSRWEIVNAARLIAQKCMNREFRLQDIDEELFTAHLATHGIPEPELLIRTSGEQRISNFLLWQIAYAELYFTPKLWPDFRKEDLYEAVADFQKRERRFGKTGEQVKSV